MVVLSACRTALGQEIKGEGLIGLTRGFFYAGAPRILASLWSIDDRTRSVAAPRLHSYLLQAVPVRWFQAQQVVHEEVFEQALIVGAAGAVIPAGNSQKIEFLVGLD